MSKNIFTLASIFLCSFAFAQVDIQFYAMRSTVPGTKFGSGWGGGFNMFSRPLSVQEKCPLKLQFGAGYYIAGAGNKKLDGVDLNGNPDPGTEITFSNMHLGFYGQTRASFQHENSRRIPYIDMFGGIRYLNASQSIIADCDTAGSTLSKYTGFSGGIGTGVMFRLGNCAWIDAGVQYQVNAAGGQFVNMNSVKNTGDGIAYNMNNAPTGMLVFKIGLSFRTSRNDVCCDFPGCTIPSHHVKSCEVNTGDAMSD